ncbi:MAG: hypothetical protein PHQ28_09550 [Mycobacterium sp.]|nr:hypothetical protein [Mycobacterium sp.]
MALDGSRWASVGTDTSRVEFMRWSTGGHNVSYRQQRLPGELAWMAS